MLSSYAVTSAMPLAEDLASKSLAVHAKPNTVLSELDRVTNGMLLNSGILTKTDDLDTAGFAKLLENATFNFDTPTQHDAMMDGFLNDVKAAVSSHLKFAKNVVKPLVMDYAERFQIYMQSAQCPGPESQYNVETFELPQPLEDMVFLETVKKYQDIKNIDAIRPQTACPIQIGNDEELLNFILTGDGEVDKHIAAWYTSTKQEGYAEVAKKLMFSPGALADAFRNRLQPQCNMNEALIIFLVANAVYNKETGLSDDVQMSTAAKNNLVAEYRNFAGAVLAAYMNHLDLLVKNQTVVLEVSSSTKTICVFGPVFRKWLEDGGRTEFLFALLSLGLEYRTIEKLKENEVRLQKEWESYSLFYHNAQANQRLNTAKVGLKLTFSLLMNEPTEDEKEYIQTHGNHTAVVNKLLGEMIDELKPSDIEQIYMTAMKVICRCRFYYTDAEFILSEIEEVARINPDVDPNEAALIATVHYIVDYLCDQMFVTNRI